MLLVGLENEERPLQNSTHKKSPVWVHRCLRAHVSEHMCFVFVLNTKNGRSVVRLV